MKGIFCRLILKSKDISIDERVANELAEKSRQQRLLDDIESRMRGHLVKINEMIDANKSYVEQIQKNIDEIKQIRLELESALESHRADKAQHDSQLSHNQMRLEATKRSLDLLEKEIESNQASLLHGNTLRRRKRKTVRSHFKITKMFWSLLSSIFLKTIATFFRFQH